MAYKGKIIKNDLTGQSITFLTTAKESDGRLLEMISEYQPFSKEPVQHYHPLQNEDFEVLKGELTVKVNGKILVLKKGDSLNILKNSKHSMWNNSALPAVVRWKVMPALRTEYFFETGMGLAADGKTNTTGMPDILQVALLANHYTREFRLARPAYILQKILFGILSPFAIAAGKKAVYKKYID